MRDVKAIAAKLTDAGHTVLHVRTDGSTEERRPVASLEFCIQQKQSLVKHVNQRMPIWATSAKRDQEGLGWREDDHEKPGETKSNREETESVEIDKRHALKLLCMCTFVCIACI